MGFDLFNMVEAEFEKGNQVAKEEVKATEDAKKAEDVKSESVAAPVVENVDALTAEQEVTTEEVAEQAETAVEANTGETADVTSLDDFDVSAEEAALDAAEAALKEKAEAAKKSPKKASLPKGATTVKPEETKFAPQIDTVIRYCGESLPLTNYIDVVDIVAHADAEKPFTLEDVRKHLEREFPELVPSHTEMLFIEKNGATYIVPTMKAKKKGNVASATSSEVGTCLPFFLLSEFLAVAEMFNQYSLEVHGDIYFDHSTKEYFLDIPPQEVHAYYCIDTEDAYDKTERIGMDTQKIAEIHSHHKMPPRPSATDDMAERVPGMTYIIVGNMNQFFPQITARKFVSDELGWVQVDVSKLFQKPSYDKPRRFDMETIRIGSGEDDE